MHHCVNCGTALQSRIIENRELEACARCGFVLWRDPKVVTIVVVEAAGGIVLGRRAIEPAYGRWCLPGGFVNDDEHPAESAARECLEEVGARVEITGLLNVLHIRKEGAPSMVGIAYRARPLPGEEFSAGSEMLEVGLFPPGEMPPLAFPSHVQAMHEWARARESSEAG